MAEAVALPSRTSILVAAARAFGSREPDESVRNPDFLADSLITSSELALIEGHPLSRMRSLDYLEAAQDPMLFPIVWLLLLRTRLIDEKLRLAVANGVKQIVIIGAGFDTRAYRFKNLLGECSIIEADAPVTQQYKKRRIAECAGQPPPNVIYCPLDLTSCDLIETLETAGWKRCSKTFFVLEGVCMYLPEDVVTKVLTQMASCSAPGSSLVLDYANQRGIQAMRAATHNPMALVANWGEPWIFGVPGESGEDYFRQCGFVPLKLATVPDPDMVKRYTSRADGSVYGAEVFQKLREKAAVLGNAEAEKRAATASTYWLAELAINS